MALEERVGRIEVEVAELQGQLGADLRHIDRRFDELGGDIKELYRLIGEINKAIAKLGVDGGIVNQKAAIGL